MFSLYWERYTRGSAAQLFIILDLIAKQNLNYRSVIKSHITCLRDTPASMRKRKTTSDLIERSEERLLDQGGAQPEPSATRPSAVEIDPTGQPVREQSPVSHTGPELATCTEVEPPVATTTRQVDPSGSKVSLLEGVAGHVSPTRGFSRTSKGVTGSNSGGRQSSSPVVLGVVTRGRLRSLVMRGRGLPQSPVGRV